MSLYYRILFVFIVGIIVSGLKKTLAQSDDYTIEVIESSPKTLGGTATHWDKKSQSLYYCDIYGTNYTMFRYSSIDDRVYYTIVDDHPFATFIVPVKGTRDRFAVGYQHSVEEIQWDRKSPKAKWVRTLFVAENCTEYASNLFSDAKADCYGRLFAGTWRTAICDNLTTVQTFGNLFRISRYEPPATLIRPKTIRVSNGMTWDEKRNKYYYIDSCDHTIKSFDYCSHTGDISNQQVIFYHTERLQPSDLLKAMTIDERGILWVTSVAGYILVIDPQTGRVIKTIFFPCELVTSVSFGGRNLDELFVTTGYYADRPSGSEVCGQLFRVRGLGVRGCYQNDARV